MSKRKSSGAGWTEEPPHRVPCQPTTVLGRTMRKLRQVNGWKATETAPAFGYSVSHISRVEHGTAKPSWVRVQFNEEQFEGEGLLHSSSSSPTTPSRPDAHQPREVRAVKGDATAYVNETIPRRPAAVRQDLAHAQRRHRAVARSAVRASGPVTAGLITSPRYVPVPTPSRGRSQRSGRCGRRRLRLLKYPPTSRWSTRRASGASPDKHQPGLDVLVRLARNTIGSGKS